jgi:murein L,D-transpeptidase YafK
MSRISELPFIACKTLRNEPEQNGFHVLVVLIEMWECADDTVHKIRFHRELEDMKIYKRRKKNIYRIHSMQA